jgi:hypothetical protein
MEKYVCISSGMIADNNCNTCAEFWKWKEQSYEQALFLSSYRARNNKQYK